MEESGDDENSRRVVTVNKFSRYIGGEVTNVAKLSPNQREGVGKIQREEAVNEENVEHALVHITESFDTNNKKTPRLARK